MKFGIAFYIAVLTTFVVILATVVTGYVFYEDSVRVFSEERLIDLETAAKNKRDLVLSDLATLREDALKLAQNKAVREALTRRSLESVTVEELRNDVALNDEFLSECRKVFDDRNYFQLRLIDREGEEIFRVGRDKNGDFECQLQQDKKGSKYLEETLSLKPSQVYLSSIQLNKEGDFRQLNKPVIRAAVPLFDLPEIGKSRPRGKSEARCIVVINFDFQAIADELKKSYRHLSYISDDAGNFIVHPDNRNAFVWNDEQRRAAHGMRSQLGTAVILKLKDDAIVKLQGDSKEKRKRSQTLVNNFEYELRKRLDGKLQFPEPVQKYELSEGATSNEGYAEIRIYATSKDELVEINDALKAIEKNQEFTNQFVKRDEIDLADTNMHMLLQQTPKSANLLAPERLGSTSLPLDPGRTIMFDEGSAPGEVTIANLQFKNAQDSYEKVKLALDVYMGRVPAKSSQGFGNKYWWEYFGRENLPRDIRLQPAEEMKRDLDGNLMETDELRIRGQNKEGLQQFVDWLNEEEYLDTAVKLADPYQGKKFVGRFHRLYFDHRDPNRFIGLLDVASDAESQRNVFAIFARMMTWLLPVVVLSALFSLVATFFVTRPLKKIATAMTRFSSNIDDDVDLPTGASSEIGVLARTFQSMKEEVKRKGVEVRENETRLRAVLKNAAEGIITVDAMGRVETFNEAAELIFGYRAKDARGQELSTLFTRDDWCEVEQELTDVSSSPLTSINLRHVIESRGLRRNGTEFPIELSIGKAFVADQQLFTIIIRDITKRKADEQAIRQLNEDLEQRVDQRTEELKFARDQALAANRAKDTFLANMSHELRTPLNAIIGYSEMLQEDAEESGQDEIVPDLVKIHSAGRHLLTLINDVLDLAKVEAGQMELHPEEFQVSALVKEVADAMMFAVKKNNNALIVQTEPVLGTMWADRTRLRQVLFNLVSNAAKFTENGKVALKATTALRKGVEGIEIQVCDTGIGMTEEQIGKLFRPFVQADSSTSRKFGGTGLGLVISKRFCNMLGGSISVDSKPGEGSRFTIWLPLEQETEDQGKPVIKSSGTVYDLEQFVEDQVADSVSISADDRPAHLLIIDDDPDVLNLLQRHLTKSGYEVTTAATGEDGLRLAREIEPDAITLDAILPKMTGWQVLTELKKDPATREIPIVMVSVVDDRSRGYALGAAEYLTKPLDTEMLKSVLAKHINDAGPSIALVVDDKADMRELVSRMLQKDGWTVVEAPNGKVALERVAKQVPSIIVLDLKMPVMNGLDFLIELRKEKEWQSIPVVVLTSMAPLSDLTKEQRESLKMEVSSVLLKGLIERDDLLKAVGREVKRSIGNTRS